MKQILFNTEMVRAILDGRKTQIRRVIKNYNNEENHRVIRRMIETKNIKQSYRVGDILYVGETFLQEINSTLMQWGEYESYWGNKIEFIADGAKERFLHPNSYNSDYMKKRPSVHLRERNARIFLKVTNARVERLQDISFDDAYNECGQYPINEHGENFAGEFTIEVFENLWNSTAKEGYKWEDNPCVFVYEFERIEKPNI